MAKKQIKQKEVKHIAQLARIEISEKEVERFQKQLESIIEYFDTLNEVDTDYVEETSQVTGLVNKLREDKVKSVLSQEEALKNAPQKKKGYFKTISPFNK